MSKIDLVLVKRYMLQCVEDAVKGMRRGLLNHSVILFKVKLVGKWIKSIEVNVRKRIRSEKVLRRILCVY